MSMGLARVEAVTSAAELLGLSSVRVVESRLAPTDSGPDWYFFSRHPVGPHYPAKDGMEAIGDPSVTDAIVAGEVDRDFLTYIGDAFGRTPVVHVVDMPNFTGRTVEEIMASYDSVKQAVFYGMWPIDSLPLYRQLIPPDAQRHANAKETLGELFPEDVLPGRKILVDPRIRTDGRSVYDLSGNELQGFKGSDDVVYLKAGRWGLNSQGIRRGATAEDVFAFYEYLVELGVPDASIILEKYLPGNGGSFTLIKRVDGEVLFNSVTEQLNVGGRRAGNIIYDIETASLQMKQLIELTARLLANSSLPHGFYTFDTIEDADGIPRPNDPANRKTGTTPPAYQRMALIRQFNLPPKDTVTGLQRLYLGEHTRFIDFIQALGKAQLTDWADERVVTVRQYLDAYGYTTVHLSLTTTDKGRLPSIEQKVRHALSMANIANSPTPLR